MAMTETARPTPDDITTSRRRWAAIFVFYLAANAACLVHQTLEGVRWLGYWWPATFAVTGAWAWVRFTDQRKEAWVDKKTAMWVWHWFTGTPLILVDDPKLPWWRDIWNCRPWLDTGPTQTTPTARRALVGGMRTLATISLVTIEYKRSGAPYGAPVVWGTIITTALAASVVGLAWLAVRKAMDRWWIFPLHLALVQLSGSTEKTRWPVEKRPRSWIDVTRAWENGKTRVAVQAAPHRSTPATRA